MIEIKPLYDIDAINKIIEILNEDVSDDLTSGLILTELPQGWEFLGVYDDNVLRGFYAICPSNMITAEIHTSLLPEFRGVKALQSGKLFLSHLFSKYLKAISYVPSYNKKALLYAQLLGFKIEGINRSSFIKNGQLLDQTLVGLTQGEFNERS